MRTVNVSITTLQSNRNQILYQSILTVGSWTHSKPIRTSGWRIYLCPTGNNTRIISFTSDCTLVKGISSIFALKPCVQSGNYLTKHFYNRGLAFSLHSYKQSPSITGWMACLHKVVIGTTWYYQVYWTNTRGTLGKQCRYSKLAGLYYQQYILTQSNVFLDASSIFFDTSNVSLDKSKVSLDTSNVSLDTSNVSLDTSNVSLDKRNISWIQALALGYKQLQTLQGGWSIPQPSYQLYQIHRLFLFKREAQGVGNLFVDYTHKVWPTQLIALYNYGPQQLHLHCQDRPCVPNLSITMLLQI